METMTINDGFLQKVVYDSTLNKLHVHFSDGNYKIYYEVPKGNYLELVASNDYTRFYQENIKKRFPSRAIH